MTNYLLIGIVCIISGFAIGKLIGKDSDLFKDNKEFDSTLMVCIYGVVLLLHVCFSAFIETYGSSESSKTIGEWISNIGLVIIGALFRKATSNGG